MTEPARIDSTAPEAPLASTETEADLHQPSETRISIAARAAQPSAATYGTRLPVYGETP